MRSIDVIKINSKSNKKDYFRLFVHWKRRCLETNIWRLVFLMCGILFFQALESPIKLYGELYGIYGGRHTKALFLWIVYCLALSIVLIAYIFVYEYVLAYKWWKRSLLIKEMGTSIQTVEFSEEFVEIKGMVLHEKVTYKKNYKEMKKICIYKRGLVFVNGKDSILVCRSDFQNQDAYERVCHWIRSVRGSKEGTDNL